LRHNDRFVLADLVFILPPVFGVKVLWEQLGFNTTKLRIANLVRPANATLLENKLAADLNSINRRKDVALLQLTNVNAKVRQTVSTHKERRRWVSAKLDCLYAAIVLNVADLFLILVFLFVAKHVVVVTKVLRQLRASGKQNAKRSGLRVF
jgi:hypothetical protein